jgi:hypothetical protein
MNRWTTLLTVVVIATLVAIGCSGGSPVTPTADQEQTPELTTESNRTGSGAQTNLLGYWDVYIDTGNGTVELLENRQAMFTLNLTNILSKQVAGLDFELNNIIIEPDHIDVDIDIIVTHPTPGYPEFNCYDLRGIFMGDGSLTLENGSLNYPELGVDQYMLPDPIDGAGGPDGYTRWFNFTEFPELDYPLFSFTAGKLTTPDFAGTATLCPYKYYTDGLQPEEDLWDWLNIHGDENGVFSESAVNARNFYIRFPAPEPGLQFSVAIIANWEGIEPEYHPGNCPEAVACEVTDNSDVYYVGPTNNGGYLNLDISLFGWEYQPSTIYIESTVLSAVASFDPATIVTGGGDHYSTYQVEIPADNVTGIEGQEYWVIAEYDGFDYTNDFGVPNETGNDPLAACFRYDLGILTESPECTTTVLGIDPPCASTDSFIDDAIITCTEIEEGPNLDARLKMTDQPDIVGTDLTILDETTLTADFDLIGAEGGFWDVVVTNGCGGIPGVGEEMFWIGMEEYDFHLIDSGDLPDPLPTSDLEFLNFCVVGNNFFGKEGVYYHYATGEPPPGDATYQIYRYPLDYLEPGTHILTFTDPFFDNFNGHMGGPQYMAMIEVPPIGGVVFTSRFPGPIEWGGYSGDAPVWWSGPSGLLENGYIFFNNRFFDLETEFGNDGSVWGYWGGETVTAFCSDPYSFAGSYPTDLGGSVDCLVSDMEAYKHAVDSDPQGLDEPYDRIFYFLEGNPDDYGIEVFQNNHGQPMPECIGTIDDALVGTPVDISCLNTYCHIVEAAGNWLFVLEDNGDSTWQVAIFDQNGILIERYPTPLDGDPFALDCDSENLEIHVWFVHEDTYKYAVFGL